MAETASDEVRGAGQEQKSNVNPFEEITKLEEQIQLSYELPPQYMIG